MSIWRCPVCGRPLQMQASGARCSGGHCFDRARQGYVNLLCSQASASRRHGDDRCMVQARQAFLEKGYYAPLLDALAALACRYAPAHCIFLDVGCGEGYYTQGVFQALQTCGGCAEAAAVDISKEAAKRMARRPFPQTTAVASAFALPIETASCDLLLSVFAPVAAAEFLRVLKPGGVLLRAVPREDHLLGLKQAVYDAPYRNPPVAQALDGFIPADRRDLDWTLELDDPADIQALFQMTPYYYKTSVDGQARAAALARLSTPLSFAVLADRKPAQNGI